MTHTAIEWLVKQYHDNGTLYYEDISKAKEMEKEQIIDAWNDGICIQDTNDICGEYYYNDTYKK